MRLRNVATLNPPVEGLGRIDAGRLISFIPLEAVWPLEQFDPSREMEFEGDVQSYNPVADGDILLPKVAPTFAQGRVAIAGGLTGGRALATSEVFVIRPQQALSARFLAYRLRARDFIDEGVASWTGVAGLKRVSGSFVRNASIDEGAWDTRDEIADFLDRECGRIATLRAALAEAPRGVTAELQASLDELVRGAPEASIKHLGYRVEQGWSPEAEDRAPAGDEVGVLRLSAVSSGTFRPREAKALSVDTASQREIDRYRVRAGDVLLVRASGSLQLLGAVCLVEAVPARPMLFPDIVYRLRPSTQSPGLPPALLCATLRTARGRASIERAKRGAANNKLRIEDVRSLRVPVAAESQVAGLLARLDRAERLISDTLRVAASIDSRLAEYRDALITEAVTGRLDVTRLSDARLDESARAAAEGEAPEVLAG